MDKCSPPHRHSKMRRCTKSRRQDQSPLEEGFDRMKRTLTVSLATALLFALVAPAALAQSGPTLTPVQRVFRIDGHSVTTGDAFSGDGTLYVPLWYVMQTLHVLGISAHWNGTVHMLNIELPSWFPAHLTAAASTDGSPHATILVNGVAVLNTPYVDRIDPYTAHTTKIRTTYVPLQDLFGFLRSMAIVPSANAKTLDLMLDLAVHGGPAVAIGGTDDFAESLTNTSTGAVGTVPQALIAWKASPQGATISPDGAFRSQVAGTYTVTGAYAYATPQAPVSVLAPAAIKLTANPTTLVAGSSETTQLTATVVDSQQQPVPGALVTFTSADPQALAIAQATATTDAAGQAAVPADVGEEAMTVSLTATTSSLSATTSVDVGGVSTVIQPTPATTPPAPVATSIVASPGQPISLPAGQAQTVTFTVYGASGQPLPDVALTFATTGTLPTADLGTQAGETNAAGQVTFTFVDTHAGDTGTIAGTATGTDVSGQTAPITIVAGAPTVVQATYVATSEGTPAVWNGVSPTFDLPLPGQDTVVFTVFDAYGNPVPDAPVDLTLFNTFEVPNTAVNASVLTSSGSQPFSLIPGSQPYSDGQKTNSDGQVAVTVTSPSTSSFFSFSTQTEYAGVQATIVGGPAGATGASPTLVYTIPASIGFMA